jgi:F0F1-type ATP synthase assembly protein I
MNFPPRHNPHILRFHRFLRVVLLVAPCRAVLQRFSWQLDTVSRLQTRRQKDTIEAMADDKNSSPKKEWVKAEGYLQLGITLPAAIFLGWVLGALLDRWLHTHWITFAGLMLGIVTGFYQLIRVAITAGKEE